MKFSVKVGNGPMNRRLNFDGDPDTDPYTDPYPYPDPYRDTGKTCLGGGMHCPSASSSIYRLVLCSCSTVLGVMIFWPS